MEKTIFLVRHAEPDRIGEQRRYLGQSDPILGTTGICQAQRLSQILRNWAIQAVYSSDLQRAVYTALGIVQNEHCHLEKIREFREINLGEWEGRTFLEVKAQYPVEYEKRGLDLVNYQTPGGESFVDLQKRVLPAFEKVVEKTNGNLVIVAHAGVNRVLLSHLMQRPLKELLTIPQEYAAVNIIKENMGGYRVISVNTDPENLLDKF
jgi:probable phosphoglycerate mutase